MFAEEGFKSVRMDDIASTMNISKRTLYEMFEDKEALIRECIACYTSLQREELKRLTLGAANIFEELVIFFNRWDKAGLHNYQIIKGLKRYYPDIFHDFAGNQYREGMEEMRTKIVRGVEQGLILDTVDIDLAVSVFTYSMIGLSRREDAPIALPPEVDFSRAVRYILVHFFRGIATERGIGIIDETILKPGEGQ